MKVRVPMSINITLLNTSKQSTNSSTSNFFVLPAVKMLLLRVLVQSSMLRFSMLHLGAIVLVPFDTTKPALAQPDPPPGPNPRLLRPLIRDYPHDGEIQKAFTGVDRDQTVVIADLDGDHDDDDVNEFCSLNQKKWVENVYPSDYLPQGTRSDRWYLDFWYSYNVIFLRATSGWVTLLSRSGGPRQKFTGCAFWFRVQFPTLKDNPKLSGIIAVDIGNLRDRWIYWMPGDGDQPRQRPGPGGDNNRNGGDQNGKLGTGGGQERDGNTGPVMNAVLTGVGTGWASLQTTAVGWGTAGVESLRAIFQNGKSPTAPSGDSNDQKNAPNQGTLTDVLDKKIGQLPASSGEQSPVAMSDSSAADEFKANDETLPQVSATDTPWKLFGRDRIIRSRTVGVSCNDYWIDKPWHPAGDTVGMPGSIQIPNPPASAFGPLYNLYPGDSATVMITQWKKESEYRLDVSILDPTNNVIFNQEQILASPGQEITIDTQGRLILLFYVEVGDDDQSPISFRYGDPDIWLAGGDKWDSKDQSQAHKCVTNPVGSWVDNRVITCLFKD